MVLKKALFGYKVVGQFGIGKKLLYYTLKIRKKSILFFGIYETCGEWILLNDNKKSKFVPYKFNTVSDAETYFFKTTLNK